MRTTTATTLLLAALVALPVAPAAWRAPGSLEPDTTHDRDHGSMWTDAPVTESSRVYFNAYLAAHATSASPNSATLGSALLPAPLAHPRAMLGVWKDCNKDGYVGHAESALQEYRAELLLGDHSVCPPQDPSQGPVHNDGLWVSEMLMVGMVDPCEFEADADARKACGVDAFHLNERVLYSNATFVWGDLGAPGSVPQRECVLAPLPRGTTSGTGGLLAYVDCQLGHRVALAVNDVDRDGSLGLRFEDAERPQDSSSLLNQPFPVTPFGGPQGPGLAERDADRRAFTAWDCDRPEGGADARDPTGLAPRDLVVEDPTPGGRLSAHDFPWVIPYTLTGVGFEDHDRDPNTPGRISRPLADEDGSYAWAPAAAPSVDDPTASWWDGAEHALDGPNGDCDGRTALHDQHPAALVEGDQAPILEGHKDRTSFTFTFFDGHRGINPRMDDYAGPSAPSDGGHVLFRHDRGGAGPMWSATAPFQHDPQVVTRGDLTPTPAVFLTWYAQVGDDVIQAEGLRLKAGSTTYTYGSDNCGTQRSGEKNGWACDPTAWWKDAEGNDVTPRYAQGERLGRIPGDAYRLRDVDCFDGALARGAPAHASLAWANGETCPDPEAA